MLIERLRTTLRADDAYIKSEATLAVALRSVFLFTMLLQFAMLCERTLLQFTMVFERIDAHKSDISSCSSQCLSIYHVAARATLAVALRSVFLFTMLLQFTMFCERTFLQSTMLFDFLPCRCN